MIECELFFNTKEYAFRPHACQAISGFLALKQQNIISLKIDYNSKEHIQPTNTFFGIINNRKVYYDVEDGTENLSPEFIDYLHRENILLFKRAYDERLFRNDLLIRPYGLNYNKTINSFFEKAAFRLAKQGILSPRILHPSLSRIKDWSMHNNSCDYTNRILFCTRLWSQNDTRSPVDELNEKRIQVARSLRKSFPDCIAGVSDSPLSRRMCKDLILSPRITKRNHFLELIGKSSICVATRGLYRSTGWRMGEFVASGKAILSEPLSFSVPGGFCEGNNYLSFSSQEELIEKCDYLLGHPEKRIEIELNNINYYFHDLRPDILIWNTIEQVIE